MNVIKQWAEKYCAKERIPYEELVDKALNMYKRHIEQENSIAEYVASSEFENCISKLYKLINNECGWRIQVVSSKDEKNKYAANLKNYLSSVVLSKNTNLIKISNNNKLCAYIILSYEIDSFGNYAFIHNIDFIQKEITKYYKFIVSKLSEIAENRSFMYLDRIIYNVDEDELVKRDYIIMWKNNYVKLDLIDYDNEECDYSFIEDNNIFESYKSITKVIPERFDEKLKRTYRIWSDNSLFYVSLNVKNDKCYMKLYVEDKLINEEEYMKYVYKYVINFLFERGIKEIYTSIIEKHIMLLDGSIKVEKEGNSYWVRKKL